MESWTAQRRPEITPGYDPARISPATTRVAYAQRRPEITPGYDPPGLPSRSGPGRQRSTKAGDYPRLRPPERRPLLPLSRQRSTKAGDYPRLRRCNCNTPARVLRRSTKAGDYPRLRLAARKPRFDSRRSGAQRRPEITPGYDAVEVDKISERMTGTAQRRPEITPGYDHDGSGRLGDEAVRSTKAGDYPRLRRLQTEIGRK